VILSNVKVFVPNSEKHAKNRSSNSFPEIARWKTMREKEGWRVFLYEKQP